MSRLPPHYTATSPPPALLYSSSHFTGPTPHYALTSGTHPSLLCSNVTSSTPVHNHYARTSPATHFRHNYADTFQATPLHHHHYHAARHWLQPLNHNRHRPHPPSASLCSNVTDPAPSLDKNATSSAPFTVIKLRPSLLRAGGPSLFARGASKDLIFGGKEAPLQLSRTLVRPHRDIVCNIPNLRESSVGSRG